LGSARHCPSTGSSLLIFTILQLGHPSTGSIGSIGSVTVNCPSLSIGLALGHPSINCHWAFTNNNTNCHWVWVINNWPSSGHWPLGLGCHHWAVRLSFNNTSAWVWPGSVIGLGLAGSNGLPLQLVIRLRHSLLSVLAWLLSVHLASIITVHWLGLGLSVHYQQYWVQLGLAHCQSFVWVNNQLAFVRLGWAFIGPPRPSGLGHWPVWVWVHWVWVRLTGCPSITGPGWSLGHSIIGSLAWAWVWSIIIIN